MNLGYEAFNGCECWISTAQNNLISLHDIRPNRFIAPITPLVEFKLEYFGSERVKMVAIGLASLVDFGMGISPTLEE